MLGVGLGNRCSWVRPLRNVRVRVRVRGSVRVRDRLGLGLEEVFVFDSKIEYKDRAVEDD